MLPYDLDTYFAIVADLNGEQTLYAVLAVLLGLAVSAVTLWPRLAEPKGEAAATQRIGLAIAAAWIGAGTVFYGIHLAPYFFAAPWLQWGFVAQGLLVAAIVALRPPPAATPGMQVRAGRALVVYAVVALPLVDAVLGPGWPAVRIVGLAPEPTLLLTAGWLLTRRPGAMVALLAVGPLLGGLFTGWSAVALGWTPDWLVVAAAVVAFGAQPLALLRDRRPRQGGA